MKNILILFCASLFIISCNNNADQPAADNDTANAAIHYAWEATLNDTSGKLEMKKTEATALDSLSPLSVVDFINTKDSAIHLNIIKISNDTIYLKIPDASYLTQQMGSTGPEQYFAGAVYNLTEIPGIRFVHFDFKEGDHASPGTFTRDSFKGE
jgi:hypothetical protein